MDLQKLEELIGDRKSLKSLGLEQGYYHMETGKYLGYHDDYKGSGSITEEELDDIAYFLDFPRDIIEARVGDNVFEYGLQNRAIENIYGKIYRHDLLERQNLTRHLCENHILLNVTVFIEKILGLDHEASTDDFSELFDLDYLDMFEDSDWTFDESSLILYTDKGEEYQTYKSKAEFIEDLPYCYSDWDNNIELSYHEPLEYYVVTDYLAKRLKERGQPVTFYKYLWIWGRCTFGQAIFIDNVMEEIAIATCK